MTRLVISILVALLLMFSLVACANDEESGEHSESSESGEHSGQSESGEHSGGEESDSDEGGEESGTQYGLTDTRMMPFAPAPDW